MHERKYMMKFPKSLNNGDKLVNATDRCHFKDAFDNSFRCHGINKILRPLLKSEYERKKPLTKPMERMGNSSTFFIPQLMLIANDRIR